MFSIFSTAQKLPKIFTEFFGKCKFFHKKLRKNKRKTFQSPIWMKMENKIETFLHFTGMLNFSPTVAARTKPFSSKYSRTSLCEPGNTSPTWFVSKLITCKENTGFVGTTGRGGWSDYCQKLKLSKLFLLCHEKLLRQLSSICWEENSMSSLLRWLNFKVEISWLETSMSTLL